jgi:hypothetical protein
MPRKSAAALSIAPVGVLSAPPRLAPPPTLSAAEREVWRSTTDALPPDWFAADNAPLLERFCVHVVRARCLEAAVRETDPANDLARYAKLTRLSGEETGRMLAVARSLRLTLQARLKAETAATRSAARGAVDVDAAVHRLTGGARGD